MRKIADLMHNGEVFWTSWYHTDRILHDGEPVTVRKLGHIAPDGRPLGWVQVGGLADAKRRIALWPDEIVWA